MYYALRAAQRLERPHATPLGGLPKLGTQHSARSLRWTAAALSESSTRTIVLAVDGTQDTEYAVQWAVQHLHRPGDAFRLAHCVPTLRPGQLVAVPGAGLLRVPRIDPALLAEQAQQAADGALRSKLMAQLEAAGLAGSFEAISGPPASSTADKGAIGAALCQRAKEAGAAAVVVASASRGGLQEALLGSIAANLVHHCEVPVIVLHRPSKPRGQQQQQQGSQVRWLMRATADEVIRHGEEAQQQQQQQPAAAAAGSSQGRSLVVAVADSDEGYAAVDWVLAHMWRPGDMLHVLHVVPALPAHMTTSLAPDGMLYSIPLPQMEEAQVEESYWRGLLQERLGPLLQQHGVGDAWQLDVITDYGGDPLQGVAAAVVQQADALGAAALVVTGHSRGTLVDWLLGSVSDYAAHHAAVPVVVLHGRQQ